eukprot:gnl/Spiro4/6652_TR3433_c0_g1_i1.p1 gnl/Spiro4/6652_TR3433_c0_g1~~gnl/Spiro4/6652_TR3433_c0_g1_i1.p1  ORF type:complete len:331 (-),score=34.94 gnl/Spiro4/6652_TR3433_c0_g1_i1:1070-2026(-)
MRPVASPRDHNLIGSPHHTSPAPSPSPSPRARPLSPGGGHTPPTRSPHRARHKSPRAVRVDVSNERHATDRLRLNVDNLPLVQRKMVQQKIKRRNHSLSPPRRSDAPPPVVPLSPIELPDSNTVLAERELSGWVHKQRPSSLAIFQKWQNRFFVLKDGRCSYYKTYEKSRSNNPQDAQGSFLLNQIERVVKHDDFHFDVVIPGRVFVLKCDSAVQTSKWVASLSNTPSQRLRLLQSQQTMLREDSSAAKRLQVISFPSAPSMRTVECLEGNEFEGYGLVIDASTSAPTSTYIHYSGGSETKHPRFMREINMSALSRSA